MSESKSKSQFKIKEDLLFGGLAGMVAKTTIAPFDRVKIYFQTNQEVFSYRKFFQIFHKIIQKQGIHGLWRGNSAMLIRVFPFASIQLTLYDSLRTYIQNKKNCQTSQIYVLIQRFMMGSFAGLSATLLTYPLDITRTRLIFSHDILRPLSIFRYFYNEIFTLRCQHLYQGLGMTLLGSLLYSGSGFAIFETLRIHYGSFESSQKLSSFQALVFGALSGLISQIFSYPIDILRRNYQVYDLVNYGKKPSLNKILNSFFKHKSQKSLKDLNHIMIFYKALSINFVKGPIAHGISLMVFVGLKNISH